MKIKPTQKQLNFLDWEFGVFFHFGIRAFFPGHVDWDGKPMPAEKFNPTELDCKQWVRTAKKAGAKYCILTCKHHDGFANWQSKYSDYSVAQSPWENGKGDVVACFVDACRRYGMKVGLYYSPAQWGGSVKFNEPREYDDYFVNQITELLSNYGKIDYLWFDGCGSENHEYDKERIIKTIRTLQPEISIFDMWDPESRWVGNEDGYADMPNNNIKDKVEISVNSTEEHSIGGARYLPAECDMKLRTTWFDCEANVDTIKSVDELVGCYEYSVGRGANLLLNVGPDHRGLIPEKDAERLVEFGEEIGRRYKNSLGFSDLMCIGENKWAISTITPAWNSDSVGVQEVDTCVIEEDISDGEAIKEFRIMASLPCYTAKSICVYIGKNIGHKAICRFPTMMTGKLTLEVTDSDGEVKLKSMKAYKVSK